MSMSFLDVFTYAKDVPAFSLSKLGPEAITATTCSKSDAPWFFGHNLSHKLSLFVSHVFVTPPVRQLNSKLTFMNPAFVVIPFLHQFITVDGQSDVRRMFNNSNVVSCYW